VLFVVNEAGEVDLAHRKEDYKMSFSLEKVEEVSQFLQSYMKQNNINSLSADEAAQLLADNSILSNEVGPKPGFNFRQMLRDGRDKKISLVKGAFQARPNTKWIIKLVDL
jgi:hypothetical protein